MVQDCNFLPRFLEPANKIHVDQQKLQWIVKERWKKKKNQLPSKRKFSCAANLSNAG